MEQIIKEAEYTINSVPSDISFTCPCCQQYVYLDFQEEFWGSGEIVECPECGEYVCLGDWEYD